MRHEGLLYGLAFLAILGVGALLIAPRLAPPVPESPGPWEERPPVRGDAPLAPVDPPRDPPLTMSSVPLVAIPYAAGSFAAVAAGISVPRPRKRFVRCWIRA